MRRSSTTSSHLPTTTERARLLQTYVKPWENGGEGRRDQSGDLNTDQERGGKASRGGGGIGEDEMVELRK